MADEKSANKPLEKRVDKVEKTLTQVDKALDKLAGIAADFDHRLDSIQAAASTSELILAIKDVAKAIREQTGAGVTQAQLDKMAAALDANTAGIIDAETDPTKEGG